MSNLILLSKNPHLFQTDPGSNFMLQNVMFQSKFFNSFQSLSFTEQRYKITEELGGDKYQNMWTTEQAKDQDKLKGNMIKTIGEVSTKSWSPLDPPPCLTSKMATFISNNDNFCICPTFFHLVTMKQEKMSLGQILGTKHNQKWLNSICLRWLKKKNKQTNKSPSFS